MCVWAGWMGGGGGGGDDRKRLMGVLVSCVLRVVFLICV